MNTNTTFTTSTVTCTGGFSQTTTTIENALGPTDICIGTGKSTGFHVCAGTQNFNANTDTILASTVAVPTLSLWALGALGVALGALALRRLAAS